jgi:hypothetical protein
MHINKFDRKVGTSSPTQSVKEDPLLNGYTALLSLTRLGTHHRDRGARRRPNIVLSAVGRSAGRLAGRAAEAEAGATRPRRVRWWGRGLWVLAFACETRHRVTPPHIHSTLPLIPLIPSIRASSSLSLISVDREPVKK